MRLLRILLLLLSVMGATSAGAVVQTGPVTFGPPSPTLGFPFEVLDGSGLRFYNTWFLDSDAGANYIPPHPGPYATTDCAGTCYGTSANPARIGTISGYDHFNISSLEISSPGTNSSVTITAYLNGAIVDGKVISLTSDTYSFKTVQLDFTNINELRFAADGDGFISIDNLMVSPNFPTLAMTPAAGTLTAGAMGVAYSQTFAASGGSSYVYSISAGALPTGLSLNTANGVVSGTPSSSGTFSFTVTATDVTTATISQVYSLTIAPPGINITPATVPGGTVATAYSQSFSASGGTGPYTYTIISGSLPAGLTLSSGGVLSGTPTAGGTFTFAVRATDSSGGTGPYSGTSSNISLTIAAPTLGFSPATLPAATPATAYSQQINVSGGTAPYNSFVVASGSLPPGLTLNATGLVSGTPIAAGNYSFTVSASDSSTGSGPYSGTSGTIAVTVNAPTLTLLPTSLPNPIRNTVYTQTLTAGGGVAPYTFSVSNGSLPPGLSLATGGTLSGTPTAEGTYNFTVQATDSTGGTGAPFSTLRTYSVTVNPPLPIVNAASATVAYNSSANPVTLNITGGAPSSVAVASGASHGTAVASGTSITYTPNTGYSGSDSFTYTATNASGTSAPATVTITVNPQLPGAGPVNATVGYNSSANAITLNITGGAPSSVAVASGASHGTAVASGTSITYTPNTGYSGSDTFTYTATNATGTSAPATVTVTVNPQVPTAGAVSATVAYGSGANPITLNIGGGMPTSVAVASGASHGMAVASGTSITYTPNAGYSGSDSFTYTASNAGGTSAPATVTITVNPQVPVAGAVSATVAYGSSANAITLNIGGGAPSSVAVVAGASHGTATASGTSITYTPTAGYSGSDSFTYTATNAGGTSAPATVTITVTPQVPVAGAVSVAVAYNSSANPIALNLAGGGAPTSVAVVVGASHGTATASGTSITYTPTAGYVGSDSFTYTATNAGGTSAPATVTVTVNPQVPVAGAVSATVAFGSSANPVTLSISGGVPTSVAVATPAQHGTATASGTSITYTPAAGYSGNDSFTYTATNAGGTSAPATVTITVNPQAPVAGAVNVTVQINSANNPIPLNLTGGAANSVAVNGAAITYSPNAGFKGTDSFVYTATNTTATSAPATVTIQVMGRPDPTQDATVTGLVGSQVETARRFSQAQIGNFQSRLESLHGRLRRQDGAAAPLAGGNLPGQGPTTDGPGSQNPQPPAQEPQQRQRRGNALASAQPGSPVPTMIGTGSVAGVNSGNGVPSGSMGGGAQPQAGGGGFDPFSLISGGRLSAQGLPSLNIGSKSNDAFGSGIDVWSAGVINIGRQEDAGMTFTTSGISFGADRRFGDKLVLGVGAGFGRDWTKLQEGGRNSGNDYSFSLYGSYQPMPGTFIDAIVGVGHLEMESRRYSAPAGTFATAKRSGTQWFASVSGAYEFRTDQFLLSPYGRLDLAETRLDATSESGAGFYNLTYFSQTVNTTKLSWGLRGETVIALESARIRPNFRTEYQHDFEDPGVARVAYADDLGGAIYQIAPTRINRNALVFGLGSDVDFKRSWSLGARYQYSNSMGSMTMHIFSLSIRNSF